MKRWLILLTACGKVSTGQPDAPLVDATSNGDVPTGDTPGALIGVRSLDTLAGLGLTEGPAGLVVTGALTAPANLGGDTLVPVGATDMVVASFKPADAAHLYSYRYGASGNEFAFLDGTDNQGLPFVYGFSTGAMIDVGQGPVASDTTMDDGFVGRYGIGAPTWLYRLIGPGRDQFTATAAGPTGSVYAAGWFDGSATFNGATLTSNGGRDIVLARFDGFRGTVQLTTTYGGAVRDEPSSMAFDGTHLIMGGFFAGTLVFGGAASTLTSAGDNDCFVAKLDGDGRGVWATRFGAAGDDRIAHVAVDGSGDIYITGVFHDTIAVGSRMLASVGDFDVFAAKLRGGDGSVVWARSFGTAALDLIGEIAADGAGHVLLAVTLGGSLPGASDSRGGLDALIVSLDAAQGTERWRRLISSPNDDRGGAVIYGADGAGYALVSLGGAYDFGMPVIGSDRPASAILKFVP